MLLSPRSAISDAAVLGHFSALSPLFFNVLLILMASQLCWKRRKKSRAAAAPMAVRGDQMPENPAAWTPFARERQRIEASIVEDKFAFHFKQAISVDTAQLMQEHRKFSSILQPIFQVMRLFLEEKQLYAGILGKFPLTAFPAVLIAFARTIELAALNQLRHFCFTKDPRVLLSKFRLLRIIKSLCIQ